MFVGFILLAFHPLRFAEASSSEAPPVPAFCMRYQKATCEILILVGQNLRKPQFPGSSKYQFSTHIP
jgi:hypothetical protein